jgi:hypothetical protein
MLEQFLIQALPAVMLWVVFAVVAGMIHKPWQDRVLWFPVRLTRRALKWALIELANAIGGGKK